jgi:hypothetical protein
MPEGMHIFGHRITRDEVAKALEVLLIAVIVICVVIIVLALLSNGLPTTRPTPPRYPTTHFTVTPNRPTHYYKNCREAHADGRWNIPEGDPAYRPALDGDHNGIACESPKSRGAGR